ncbi:MAG: nitroreductase family protein [Clostridiales bacterium]|nr:nitroreductase family protein [Clostridiales bacterium]
MSETLRVIAERYSCRDFEGKPVEREKLDLIAAAAVQSPSGSNRQPWEIVILTDKTLIDEMDAEGMAVLSEQEDKSVYERFMERGGKLYYNAPCMFLILQRPGREMDTGIVSENISLAAAALGLGNCICGMARLSFDSKKGDAYKKHVGMDGEYEFGVAVLVGYAKTQKAPHDPDMSKVRYL